MRAHQKRIDDTPSTSEIMLEVEDLEAGKLIGYLCKCSLLISTVIGAMLSDFL